MASLGVNIDHIANVRQARLGVEPDPVQMAFLAELGGADGITIHLREDRRHIQDRDLKLLRQTIKTRLNLEMAATKEMLEIALEVKPDMITLVPEKREEITTEGGIDVRNKHNILVPKIEKIKKNNIRVSLFIDASMDQIKMAKEVGADIVEGHTGEFCRKINYNEDASSELERIREAADFSNSIGLELHFGHGITFDSVVELSKIKEVKDFNVGHFIISESIFIGLEKSISKFRELIKKGRKIQ